MPIYRFILTALKQRAWYFLFSLHLKHKYKKNIESTNIEETKIEHKQNKTKKKNLFGNLAYIMVNVNHIFIPVYLKQLNDCNPKAAVCLDKQIKT